MSMTHSEQMELILDYLTAREAWFYPTHRHRQGTRPLRRGVPDLIGGVPIGPYKGTLFGIEIKVGKDQLTPDQEKEMAAIQQSGGIGILARAPGGLATVIGALGMESRLEGL